jgi:hypothetical protein
MTPPQRKERGLPRHIKNDLKYLEGHAEHLLDGVLWLKRKHSMLRPMRYKEIIAWRGSGKQQPGFLTLRTTLFFSCAQDVANLCLDEHKQSPSILKIMTKLTENRQLLGELRRRYSISVFPVTEEERADPGHMAIIRDLEQQRTEERTADFDKLYRRLQTRWDSLACSRSLGSLKSIRDKLVAHTDLTFVGGVYKPLLDLKELGLTWDHLRLTIDRTRRVTELINQIVRGAGFAWDDLEEQHDQTAYAFWGGLPNVPGSTDS